MMQPMMISIMIILMIVMMTLPEYGKRINCQVASSVGWLGLFGINTLKAKDVGRYNLFSIEKC